MTTEPQFPTYESLSAGRVPLKLSMDMLRIRWKPFGPLETSVYIAGERPRSTYS
jgi:hypothetical protein